MTSTERVFLQLERDGYPIDVVGIFLLAAHPDGPLAFDEVRRRLDNRTRQLPLFSQKLAQAPLGIGEDRWTTAEQEVNIDDHLRTATVPAPGDDRALFDEILARNATPLDRSKPLWDAWYLTGLSEGRAALTIRVHHALVDGMGSMEVIAGLFDLEPTPVDMDHTAMGVPPGHEPGFVHRVLREVPDRLANEVTATSRLTAATTSALTEGAARRIKTAGRAAVRLTTTGRLPAGRGLHPLALPALPGFFPSVANHPPVTLLNRHVRRPEKSFAVASLSLSEVLEVKRAVDGVTVNDVILALVTGTLRAYLAAHDDLPNRPLRTSCPVNLREGGEPEAQGNEFTTMWIDLPVHLEDPQARLQAVHTSADAAKRHLSEAQAAWDALSNVGDLLLPGIVGSTLALAGSRAFQLVPPTLNLTVSTVRGTNRPLYLGDRQIEHFFTRAITCPPIALFIHSTSYAGLIEFSITAIAEVVPDPDALTAGMRAELDVLLDLVRR